MIARRRLTIPIVACAVAFAGCFTPEEWRRFWDLGDRGAQPEPSPRLVSKSKATRNTIGELVTLDGLRLLQVRGFGLVVDLAGTGGSDGPEAVRKYLIKEVQRWQRPSEPGLSPSELLSGLDTAMVEVTGLVPAAAQKGDPFDVVVRALGTQTKSLATGRLVLCELKPWAETLDGILGAKAVAAARGPIFISPIGLDKEIPDKIDLHTGLVLGGGAVKRPRQARLVLNDPSPSVARRIVDRLNGRYATGDPIAVARSHTAVEITIPRAYRGRKRLFLEHVLHTTLNADPASLERRAIALADEITHPDAEFESVGVAWEAMGRIAL
ncbi:MAG: flagellar basal body P-ring protein FlgI, partial [Dehalococcoidia bacterium]